MATLKDPFNCLCTWSKDSQRLLSSCGDSALELSTMRVSSSSSTIEARDALLSPNEKYIAYNTTIEYKGNNLTALELQSYRKRFGSEPQVLIVIQGNTVIYKRDFRITGNPEPPFAWSPNGDILVFRKFVKDSNEPDIVLLYAPAGQVALLGSDERYPLFWSPSGHKLAYKTEKDIIEIVEIGFRTSLFSFTIAGKHSFPLTKLSSVDSFEKWLVCSPDERYIAFSYNKIKENIVEGFISFPAETRLIDLETGAQTSLLDKP